MTHMSTRERLAREAAKAAVNLVIDQIHELRMEVHDNPVYWAAFHRAILEDMAPARRRIAWWHKRRLRNAKAAIKAHAALAAACSSKIAGLV